MITRREFVKLGAAVGAGMVVPVGSLERALAFTLSGQGTVADPTLLAKYVDRLPIPGVMPSVRPGYYEVGAYPLQVKVHRDIPVTKAWGYRPKGWTQGAPEPTYLGPSFVARKDSPIRVLWSNELVDGAGDPIPHPLPVDPSLDWAAPFGDNMMMGPFPVDGTSGLSTFDYTLPAVPITPHVHGAEVEPQSDGGPNTWFTPDWEQTGPDWKHRIYRYANGQPAATIWYHDHAMGLTRLNVYMGLAGAYVITDPAHEPKGLPRGVDGHGVPRDIPLVLQDRLFDTSGQLYFPAVSDNPAEHPFWVPEFFGDHMLVNGKVWPYLDVEPRAYRFRILDGSNARFYRLWISPAGKPEVLGPKLSQIATDGGYLYKPVTRSSAIRPKLVIAPGERAEVVVDFSQYAGKTLRLYNDAAAPFPMGDPTVPGTTGQIMEFRVRKMAPKLYTFPKNPLNPKLASYPSHDPSDAAKVRILTLNELESANGPLGAFLNLTAFRAEVSEKPIEGTFEIWKIVNTTGDTHPIHTHLTQMQLLSRQGFDAEAYDIAFTAVNGDTIFDGDVPNDSGHMAYAEVDPTPYLNAAVREPARNERGWKDTIRCEPEEVTTMLVRFAPIDGRSQYPFDVTAEPGYVWHCHIVDHEDNEMMRPYALIAEEDDE
jgi:spore coat protein A, manganese oxidase